MKTGFTCGSFDLLHAGHVLMLEECKEHCDFLLVGLQTDPSYDRTEKQRPVQTVLERQIQLAAVRHVDAVVIYDTEADLRNLLLIRQPDIRFVSEEYRLKPFTANDIEEIEIHYNSRRHDFSSSGLRARCQEGTDGQVRAGNERVQAGPTQKRLRPSGAQTEPGPGHSLQPEPQKATG